MTNNKILIAIMQRATSRGYKCPSNFYWWQEQKQINKDLMFFDNKEHFSIVDNIIAIRNIIFNHDFAKAFWGEDMHIGDEWWLERDNWEHHLEVMVLEKEPLKYLEKFL